MSVENFLKDAVDADAINHYLRLLAERQLQAEQTNKDLSACLQLSKQALLKAEEKYAKFEQDLNVLARQQKHQLEEQKSWVADTNIHFNHIDRELSESKQWSKIIETRIDRFVARSNGTALDTSTSLIWCRYSIGQRWENGKVLGIAKKMYPNEAMAAVDTFNNEAVGGYTDWRLPTSDELSTIVENGKEPRINRQVFPNTPAYWFLSSSSGKSSNSNKIIKFGDQDYKQDAIFVRLVR